MSMNTQNTSETYNASSDLTDSQMKIWSGQLMNPDKPLYNMAFTFKIKGEINVARFKEAFQRVVDEYDVLRVTIGIENNLPKQHFRPSLKSTLKYMDLSRSSFPENYVKASIEEDKKRIFEPGEILYKTALFKLESNLYIWYINQHHLITDGWSVAQLYKKMSLYYQQLVDGMAIEDADIPTYESHSNLSVQEASSSAASFWKKRLDVFNGLPALYGNKNLTNSSDSTRYTFTLGKERTERLKEFCTDPDIKAWTVDLALNNVFLAAISILIHKVSGQEQFAVGVPSHYRFNPKSKETLGLYMGLLPVFTSISSTDSLLAAFHKTRDESFEVLKNSSNARPSAELLKTFNAVLNFIPQQFSDFAGFPMSSEWVHPEHHDAGHHLRLQIQDFDNQGDLKLQFDLNNEVFDPTLADRLPQQFIKILDAFIESKNLLIEDLDIITKEEEELFRKWNSTNVSIPESQTLISSFEEQVERTPTQTALLFEGEDMSYREFNQQVNRLAHYLVAQGINSDEIVAVSLERSFEMMICIYAVLKTGAAYLPIDTKNPEKRTELLLADANCNFFLTDRNFDSRDRNVFNTASLFQGLNSYPDSNPNLEISPKDLAYVIYTSGSTGTPKGVKCHHRGIVNRLLWMNERYALTHSDTVAQKTPITFDVSLWELFWPLQVGARLVIAKPEDHKDSAELIRLINTYDMTTIHFVPSMLNAFLRDAGAKTCMSLRQVFSSGEALSKSVVDQFHNSLTAELYNLYGPTETSVDVTAWHCKKEDESTSIPIGNAVANTQLYVLDEKLKQVPIGTPGELYIGGEQVAYGYLNNEELTQERFITDHFSDRPKAHLYKTGDLVRYRKDGALEYLGRQDYQVKLRGFRIELGEIEARMVQHSDVQQAVVIKQEGEDDLAYLVAYYTGALVEENQMRSLLAQTLPYYMTPSFFQYIEEFELTSSGKIDRKKLPKHHISATDFSDQYRAPETQLEEMVTEVWEEILQVERIGVKDNFTQIGGDSLKALVITSRLKEMLDLDLSVHLVFSHSNIAAYSQYLEERILEVMTQEEI